MPSDERCETEARRFLALCDVESGVFVRRWKRNMPSADLFCVLSMPMATDRSPSEKDGTECLLHLTQDLLSLLGSFQGGPDFDVHRSHDLFPVHPSANAQERVGQYSMLVTAKLGTWFRGRHVLYVLFDFLEHVPIRHPMSGIFSLQSFYRVFDRVLGQCGQRFLRDMVVCVRSVSSFLPVSSLVQHSFRSHVSHIFLQLLQHFFFGFVEVPVQHAFVQHTHAVVFHLVPPLGATTTSHACPMLSFESVDRRV